MSANRPNLDDELWFSALDAETLDRFNKDKAYAAFQQRVAARLRLRRRRWLGVAYSAAALCVMAIVSLLSFRQGRTSIQEQMADIVISVPNGARTSTTLPDGTEVWLNAGSRLVYSQNFGIENRLINLVGEGYFKVARDERLPFCVSSEHLRVRVLGTVFNLRDYPEDAEAAVSLSEGAVSLASTATPEKEIRLKPDQRATLNKASGRILVETFDTATASQWTDGRLVFDGEDLSSIMNDLERNYDIRISVSDDKLLDLHFYGAFLRQEQSLTEILDALSATGRLRYRQEGKNVTLYPPN